MNIIAHEITEKTKRSSKTKFNNETGVENHAKKVAIEAASQV